MKKENKKKPSARAVEKISEVTEEIADIWNGFTEEGVRDRKSTRLNSSHP